MAVAVDAHREGFLAARWVRGGARSFVCSHLTLDGMIAVVGRELIGGHFDRLP